MAMMTTRFTTYRASGRLGPLTIAYFAAAIVAAAGAAWLYQMLMTWIPYIYVNLVLCGLFGAGLGAAGAFAVRRGHCRNRLFAFVLTLPLAAAGLGASYYWAYESTLAKIAEQQPRHQRRRRPRRGHLLALGRRAQGGGLDHVEQPLDAVTPQFARHQRRRRARPVGARGAHHPRPRRAHRRHRGGEAVLRKLRPLVHARSR